MPAPVSGGNANNTVQNDDTQNPPVNQQGGEGDDSDDGNTAVSGSGGNDNGNSGGTPASTPAPSASAGDDIDARVAAAVTAALRQEREAREQAERERIAREGGDYKTLYEQSEAEKRALQLDKWRGQALAAAGLDSKWFDSIQGNTLEEMTTFAKNFKKNLDAEIKAAGAQIVEEHPGTPRGGDKSGRTRTKEKDDSKTRTKRVLGQAFGVHTLPRT